MRGVEWSENWWAWPHCNGQAGCWMHIENPWCRCACRWCRIAGVVRRRGRRISLKVWRCRWCGRRVHGVFGWFHKIESCKEKPMKCDECGGRGMVDYFDRQRLVEDEMPCPSCQGVEV